MLEINNENYNYLVKMTVLVTDAITLEKQMIAMFYTKKEAYLTKRLEEIYKL
jgi:hypothetical protein